MICVVRASFFRNILFPSCGREPEKIGKFTKNFHENTGFTVLCQNKMIHQCQSDATKSTIDSFGLKHHLSILLQ